jgi:hypothetical protein
MRAKRGALAQVRPANDHPILSNRIGGHHANAVGKPTREEESWVSSTALLGLVARAQSCAASRKSCCCSSALDARKALDGTMGSTKRAIAQTVAISGDLHIDSVR